MKGVNIVIYYSDEYRLELLYLSRKQVTILTNFTEM